MTHYVGPNGEFLKLEGDRIGWYHPEGSHFQGFLGELGASTTIPHNGEPLEHWVAELAAKHYAAKGTPKTAFQFPSVSAAMTALREANEAVLQLIDLLNREAELAKLTPEESLSFLVQKLKSIWRPAVPFSTPEF